jgi:stage II sporulation protein R
MKNIFKIQLSVGLALLICCIANISVFSNQCDGIRDKMLRMHVIANSDTKKDQELKLKVRDAVLCKGKEIFDGSITADEAEERITPYIHLLEKTAKETIIDEGYDYNVKITVQEEYFKTRTYDNSVTLPAGYYTAVKVIIGEGKGQNWWCIMFPPMCLPAADAECNINDVLNFNENNIVSNGQKYKLKFKFVEIYEEFLKKLK